MSNDLNSAMCAVAERAGWWLQVLLLVVPALVCMLLLTSSALALSDGRVYEMVSPPYKEGYPVRELMATSPDGESVAYETQGAFDGVLSLNGVDRAVYVAHRNPSGWTSTAQMPPPSGGTIDFSTSLSHALGKNCVAPNAGTEQYDCTGEKYLLHSVTAPNAFENWEVAGEPTKSVNGEASLTLEQDASADLCHIVIGNAAHVPLVPEAEKTYQELYDIAAAPAAGCESSGQPIRMVAVKNKTGHQGEPEPIDRTCATTVGTGLLYSTPDDPTNDFNAVSGNGEEIFFTAGLTHNCTSAHQLFVRLGGERTLEVSRPFEAGKVFGGCGEGGQSGEIPGEVPCPGTIERSNAYFKGASEDGSRVFFTTTAPLVPAEDKDSQNDLYMTVIGCPNGEADCGAPSKRVTGLLQISHDPHAGQAAEVQGVVRVAPDGSRVYFVAKGDLLTSSEQAKLEGERRPTPIAGAENMYVYDTGSGTIEFIADICSGPDRSGKVADASCPLSLGEGLNAPNDLTHLVTTGGSNAQVNVCARPSATECTGTRETGRFFVFSSYAQLTPDDVNEGQDVYRYDSQSGAMQRVSVGEAGADTNGNGPGDASVAGIATVEASPLFVQQAMQSRAISEDGSRIVFATVRPLSPDAVNGVSDIYEWHDGEVSIVSTGSSETGDMSPVISPAGRDIFFETTLGLLSADTDGLYDIYDARQGGGFAVGEGTHQPCSGDACQGALTNPAPLLVPASTVQASGENVRQVTVKVERRKKTRKHKRRRAGHPGRTHSDKANQRKGGRR
jgi:hypothetical protein